MALSITGLETQTFEEVIDFIIEQQQELVSSDIDTNTDSSLFQVSSIMAQALALVNEGLQDAYDQRALDRAEGTALDDLVSLLGITRQAASATFGEQYFTGDSATVIPSGISIKSVSTNAVYNLDSQLTLSQNACKFCSIGVIAAVDNLVDYAVTIDGTLFESGTGHTTQNEVYTALEIVIDAAGQNYSSEVNASDELEITSDDGVDLNVTHDEFQAVIKVTSAGGVTGAVTGTIVQPADTVQTVVTATLGLDSTNNPNQYTTGRAVETDQELRDRALVSSTASGRATVDSIVSAILALAGVSSCDINEQFVSAGVEDTVVTIDTVVDNTNYTITINTIQYVFLSDGTATADEITAGLTLAINAGDDGIIAVDNVDSTFTLSTSTAYRVDVVVDANMSFEEGQPAGSILIVVTGGINDDIFQTIWDFKPAGVETWDDGDPSNTNTAGVVIDANGNNQFVSFVRPTSINIFFTVEYTIFDLSVYPATDQEAFDAISAAMVAFGNALISGEDVESDEFLGVVYTAVGGIKDVVVKMSDVSLGAVAEDVIISIDTAEKALFVDSDTFRTISVI